MEYKWRYVCSECLTHINYRVNMDKRFKCKQCGNRNAMRYEYIPDSGQIPYYVNYFCPRCKKAQDFRVEEHFKYCPECNYDRPRIEWQNATEVTNG